MIKLLSDYHTNKEVVKAAIEDETVRKMLFSFVEELSKDRSLDIYLRLDEMMTESEEKRVEKEYSLFNDSMDAISEIAEWDSNLVQPVIPSIIDSLNFESYHINEKAANIIAYSISADNIELISKAIPKLIELLEYREISIEDRILDNRDSVFKSISALNKIARIDCDLLKDFVPIIVENAGREYSFSTISIIISIADKNLKLLNEYVPNLIKSKDIYSEESNYLSLAYEIAQNDVDLIKPAIPVLIEFLNDFQYRGIIAKIFGAIAQKNVSYVQSAIPKLIDLLDNEEKWITVNAARSLKIISQQDESLIESSLKERLDDIIKSVSLLDEIKSSENEYFFDYSYYLNLANNTVSKNPNDPEALETLGLLLFNPGEILGKKAELENQKKGLEYLIKSAEIKPTFDIYCDVGWRYYFGHANDISACKNSLFYYTKANEINPDDIECQIQIAFRNTAIKNFDTAILLFEELRIKDPEEEIGEGRISEGLAEAYIDVTKKLNDENRYYEAYEYLVKAKHIGRFFDHTKKELEELDRKLGNENIRSKLRIQINDLKKKNIILKKDIAKKFSEVGDVAYSECTTNSHELKEDAKIKLDEILAIDTLINKSKQDTVNIKNRKQKSSFLSKLGDAISSNTKLGKLKIEIYNLEKNKNSAITDFGDTLFICHKKGEDTLSCLSDLWSEIEDIDNIISKNEEDASNIHKILDGSKFEIDEKISEKNEKTAKEWTYDAVDLFSSNKYDEAVECCDKALNLNLENENAWTVKINALRKLRRNSEAIECIDNSLDIYPEKSSLWIFKGLALHDLEKYEKAIVCFDKALEIDSEDEDAWNHKGNALRSLNRGDEALTCFDKALQINPKDAISWHNKGNTLNELKRFEDGIDCYDKVLEIDPENAKTWQNKGTSLIMLKRCNEAVTCLNQSLELDSNNIFGWVFKGQALEYLKKFDEANICFDKALELDSKNSDIWYYKGKNLGELEIYEEALKCYDKVLELDPENISVWEFKGFALYFLDRYDEAITYYDKSLKINPENVDLWKAKGYALRSLERNDEAITCFEKSQEIDSEDADIWIWKGCSLFDLDKYDEANLCCDKALELDSENQVALDLKARIFKTIE